MPFRDILAIVTSVEADRSVLEFAESLRAPAEAHLTAMVVNVMPSMPVAAEGWVLDTRWDDVVSRAREDVKTERGKLEDRYRNEALCEARSLLVEWGSVRAVVGLHARHADITVAPRPQRGVSGDLRADVVEGVLFGSGRPMIAVPPGWTGGASPDTVLVGWNAEREAARALGDARPFLEKAGKVIIATVDAKPSPVGHGDAPGVDIAEHAARWNRNVELVNLSSGGRAQSQALLDAAGAAGAGLVVMGGYGRSRFSEFIFGGVTRDVLSLAELPVLMAH